MNNRIQSEELRARQATADAPMIIDVRRQPAFEKAERMVAGACWRDHNLADDWVYDLPARREVAVYCVHGQQVSQAAAAILRAHGIAAKYLQGGFDAWETAGGATASRESLSAQQEMAWVTSEMAEVTNATSGAQFDRAACVWLIRRFIDTRAAVHFVEAEWVKDVAVEMSATAFAELSDGGVFAPASGVAFDAFIKHFALQDAELTRMANIVRGDAPQSSGVSAVVNGLAALSVGDAVEHAMPVFDALYACADVS